MRQRVRPRKGPDAKQPAKAGFPKATCRDLGATIGAAQPDPVSMSSTVPTTQVTAGFMSLTDRDTVTR